MEVVMDEVCGGPLARQSVSCMWTGCGHDLFPPPRLNSSIWAADDPAGNKAYCHVPVTKYT